MPRKTATRRSTPRKQVKPVTYNGRIDAPIEDWGKLQIGEMQTLNYSLNAYLQSLRKTAQSNSVSQETGVALVSELLEMETLIMSMCVLLKILTFTSQNLPLTSDDYLDGAKVIDGWRAVPYEIHFAVEPPR